MGSSFGQTLLQQVGNSLSVSADGRPRAKIAGVTVDWNTVAAVGADTNVSVGIIIPAGEKFIRHGQVLCRILTTAEVQTVTVGGTPTGGSFPLTGLNPDTGAYATATIPFNASAAVAQPLLDSIFGAGNTTVGGGALPGAALTVTFAGRLGDVPLMTAAITGLTGGAPTVTVTTSTPPSGNLGFWGPYDPAATDGRQTLARGNCMIALYTWREVDLHSNHPPVCDGGILFKQRILMTTGTASLAAGPTVANFEAAFPAVTYADA